ncbi:hypothetical protein E8E13_002867 [Curvularia kusanoi]|uniref:Xylanolytic transcriptional activator regulatory domain-containing protein n=1 Tax=Curvularia kusanoi TaxID=90978 RepID=A0A9P4W3E5_CURKU|nr:hypothetical protein E8E13_002867 [Curvularia kusanoi]
MQQIQAFLMLGYHDWTAFQGRSGYMRIQQGVSFAKVNGYMYEDLDMKYHREDAVSRRDRFIQQESRRRTFWSCFIMDRYLSVGLRRPKILRVEDMKNTIQIPCSDKNFISGRAVRTRFFGESDAQYAERRKQTEEKALHHERVEWEDREDDGMLGRYIFTLDLFTDVNKWANKGGRRSEPADIGPWNSNTEYYHLDKRLETIRESLPEELQLNPINTENHIYGPPSAASRTYFLIHAVLMLCKTYLAPEYLPTFGFRLTKPQGPQDEPLVTEKLPADQPDYWVEKAKDCFEYVRDFVNVLQSFKERDLVVESPFMGHAIWRAAWAAMYCHHVPKMDPSNALNSKLDPNAWDITNLVLDSMKKKFRIAHGYSDQLGSHAKVYTEKRRQWKSNGGSPQSSASDNELHEYSTNFEIVHKQFGSLDFDEKKYLTQPYDRPYSKLSKLEQEDEIEDPNSPVTVFKTDGDEPRRSASTAPSSSSAFTPVNTVSSLQRDNISGPADGGNLTRSSYEPQLPQRPQQHHQPSPSYSGQTPQFGPPTYNYSGGATNFTQPVSQFDATPASYAPGSGSNQRPASAAPSAQQQQQILSDMEIEGNRSIRTGDILFFDTNDMYPGQNYSHTGYYTLGQMQSQMQFMQDPQGSYDTYPNQYYGPG